MYSKEKLNRIGLTVAMLILFSASPSVAAGIKKGDSELIFQDTPLPKALEEIGSRLGFTFIIDPNLKGSVTQTIKYDWPAETILTKVLDPFGYSYHKIENYYLIGGPGSPLTVFAQWDSLQIPVGFLTDEMYRCLESYKSYLSYDPSQGIVFIKAPASMINEAFDGIGKADQIGAQLAVIYNFSIFEFINTKEMDALFSGTISSSNPSGNKGVIITPDQISTEGYLRLQGKMRESAGLDLRIRQPRVMALPGKTTRVSSKYHLVGDEPEEDQNFSLAVTPISVDPSSGIILSEIKIDGFENRINSVFTTIRTIPGTPETLAVIRKVFPKKERLFLGNYQSQEIRYYLLTVETAPIKIRLASAVSEKKVLPAAVLDGLFLNDPDNSAAPDSVPGISSIPNMLELGLSAKKGGRIDPWFNLSHRSSAVTGYQVYYEGRDLYSVSFNRKFRPDDGAYFEISAGAGIGPDRQKAVLIGVGDQTGPLSGITFFGKYYLWSFLTETEELTNRAVWKAGLAINEPRCQLILSVSGNPRFDGYRCQFNKRFQDHILVLGIDTTETESVFIGFKLNR